MAIGMSGFSFKIASYCAIALVVVTHFDRDAGERQFEIQIVGLLLQSFLQNFRSLIIVFLLNV